MGRQLTESRSTNWLEGVDDGRRRGHAVLGLFAIVALLGASCGGGAQTEGGPSAKQLTPAEFERAVENAGRVAINVHVPDEGAIAGTDLWVPFDRVAERRSDLPPPGTPLAIYCRSGRMSAIAARTLARLGYTDLVELAGGMNAWTSSGRALLSARDQAARRERS